MRGLEGEVTVGGEYRSKGVVSEMIAERKKTEREVKGREKERRRDAYEMSSAGGEGRYVSGTSHFLR